MTQAGWYPSLAVLRRSTRGKRNETKRNEARTKAKANEPYHNNVQGFPNEQGQCSAVQCSRGATFLIPSSALFWPLPCETHDVSPTTERAASVALFFLFCVKKNVQTSKRGRGVASRRATRSFRALKTDPLSSLFLLGLRFV